MAPSFFHPGLALIFPGQGSQHIGMGEQLFATSTAARDLFLQADELLQMRLSQLCFQGPEDELQATVNQQPATFVTSLAWLAALREHWAAQGKDLEPALVAGHSMGEFTAAVAAGCLSFEDGLRLVRERGRRMSEAGDQQPGGMAAIFGLDEPQVQGICDDSADGDYVGIGARNGEDQSVISGALKPLLRAMALAEQRGARKVVRLAITIASHSPLMQEASDEMDRLLDEAEVQVAVSPLVGNVNAAVLRSGEEVCQELREQLMQAVRWDQSIETMKGAGIRLILEVGPGHILTRLVRRIDPELNAVSVSDEREGLRGPTFDSLVGTLD